MASHPHLLKRGTTYHYRRKVPVDLLGHYAPAREITFSLRTKDLREAVKNARREAVRLDEEFAKIRGMAKAEVRSVVSDVEIERVVQTYLHEVLGADEAKRFQGSHDAGLHATLRSEVLANGGRANFSEADAERLHGMSEREFAKQQQTVALVGEAARSALARGDTSIVDGEMDDLLLVHGLKVAPGSEAWRKVAVGLLKATVQAMDLLKQREQGDVVETPPAPGISPTADNLDADDLTVSALWKKYAAERQLPQKTLSDFGTYVRRFNEVNGNLLVSKVAKAHVRRFKDAMLKMPSNPLTKQRAMTVPQLLEAVGDNPNVPRLSARTVNDKALGAIGAIFGYAVREGYRDDNPVSGIRADGPRDTEPKVLPFSTVDLKTIFGSPVFTQGKRPVGGGGAAAKWLPLLALFTGARLEELGKLELKDIGCEAGVDYLLLRGAVKNIGSRRKVPIHPELKRLGFTTYVEAGRQAGDHFLFPDLKSKRDKRTASFSTWWGRHLNRIGITDKRKVFHSFRHTVKRQLRNARVDTALMNALQGHAVTDVAGMYGRDEEGLGFALPVLAEAMEQLAYPDLDLSYLVPSEA